MPSSPVSSRPRKVAMMENMGNYKGWDIWSCKLCTGQNPGKSDRKVKLH